MSPPDCPEACVIDAEERLGITSTKIPTFDAAPTAYGLPFAALIAALQAAFASGANVPPRHHHAMVQPDGTVATLLLMPAWRNDYLGTKIVAIYPGNTGRGLPGLHSTYLLSDGATGRPLALLDGNEITSRRTAAVAALGASFLAREDAETLLVVGTGRVAALLPEAFSAVRRIKRILVWGRDIDRAKALCERFRRAGHNAMQADELQSGAREADIILTGPH